MKLAFICTEKLPSPAVKGGAIQILIDGIAPLLAEKQHELTVFSITDPGLPEEEIKDMIRYIRFPAAHYADHVKQALSGKSFDVIHLFNRPALAATYRKAAPDSKFVLSLHNDMFRPDKLSDRAGREAIHAVERIVTVSDYIRKTVVDRFPEAVAKTEVVYSGVDPDRYIPGWTRRGIVLRSRARRKRDLENRKVVLFVGRLSKAKGPHLLIKAMRRIAADHPNAVLVIVGGKWFADDGINAYVRYLHRLAEPIRDHVVFTKFVPPDQLPELYLSADLFVCSSQWQEPLARVHYEAMAAGLPIVTTDRGGNAEVIRHLENGFVLTDYQKVSAFADAIDFLLSNPGTAATLAHEARERALQFHSFGQVAERLEKVYLEAFRGSGRRRPGRAWRIESSAAPVVVTETVRL